MLASNSVDDIINEMKDAPSFVTKGQVQKNTDIYNSRSNHSFMNEGCTELIPKEHFPFMISFLRASSNLSIRLHIRVGNYLNQEFKTSGMRLKSFVEKHATEGNITESTVSGYMKVAKLAEDYPNIRVLEITTVQDLIRHSSGLRKRLEKHPDEAIFFTKLIED